MPISNRKISVRGLRTFCAAARHLSFRDAAEKLFITASAVSHQIKKLEQELGQNLFDRDGASLTLTDAGLSMYSEIDPLLAELDEVASRYKVSARRDTLRISVQPFFASEYFVPRLAEFKAAHPAIDIKVDTSDESLEKHPGYVDASIRVFKSAPAKLASNRLIPLDLVPVASPAFRRALKIKSQKVISEFPRIVHESRPRAWSQWQQSAGIELPDEAAFLCLDSMIAVVRAAQRGLGAALVPGRLCGTMFDSGTLVPLFDHELATSDAYYFVCNEEDAAKANVRVLRDWVVQTFSDER